jgi:hypothetical protein
MAIGRAGVSGRLRSRRMSISDKSSEKPFVLLEYALSLARDLAHSWPRGPHQYYLCATPPSCLVADLTFIRV